MASNPAIFFRPIRGTTLSQPKIQAELNSEANLIANDMMLDLLVTTATWKRNVKFEKLVEIGPAGITILVGTDDEIWSILNKGAPAHIILPKRAKMLRFKGTYSAKSIPGVLTARPGGASGSTIYSKGVIHPGIQAREWDKALAKEWQRKLPTRVEKAIKRALDISIVPQAGV